MERPDQRPDDFDFATELTDQGDAGALLQSLRVQHVIEKLDNQPKSTKTLKYKRNSTPNSLVDLPPKNDNEGAPEPQTYFNPPLTNNHG